VSYDKLIHRLFYVIQGFVQIFHSSTRTFR
jgi:hypothetical protein